MNVLIFNDTRVETNIGCHATVSKLISFIEENIPNSKINLFEMGVGYEVFMHDMNIKSSKKKYVLAKAISKLGLQRIIKIKSPKSTTVDVKEWEKRALNKFPEGIKKAIKETDLVIINMEGTIHHDSVGGLTLLGLALFSKTIGKIVAMVNGSYQDMNEKITQKVLPIVDFLSVRESRSFNYLKSLNIKSYLIADFAFLAEISNDTISFDCSKGFKKLCLYTPGVLGIYFNKTNGISLEQIKIHIQQIRVMGYEPVFLQIEEKEEFIAKELLNLNVPTISYKDNVKYSNIGILLDYFDLLITGRYHVGIFGLMKRKKTYFLQSNTFKIEGMLEMLGIPMNIVLKDTIKEIENVEFKFDYQLPAYKSFDVFRSFMLNLNNEIKAV